MGARTVTTQAELNDALTAPAVDEIHIMSPAGVWLELGSHNKYVRASGSASVRASGSASVRAFGSASVRASGSASVRAFGSASVRAFGSASVRAFGSASVRAGRYVSVHLHSQRVTLAGGVVIDMTAVDEHDVTSWCEVQGIEPDEDGSIVVFKAVNAELVSGYGMPYPIGQSVTAKDYRPTDACGAGLHFGPTPGHAEAYYEGTTPPRFLACRVRLADAVGITSDGGTAKIKARSCVVLHEVDVHGRQIETPAAAVVA